MSENENPAADHAPVRMPEGHWIYEDRSVIEANLPSFDFSAITDEQLLALKRRFMQAIRHGMQLASDSGRIGSFDLDAVVLNATLTMFGPQAFLSMPSTVNESAELPVLEMEAPDGPQGAE